MVDFLGRPVQGEIQHYADAPVEQDNPQALLDAIDSLLGRPEVVGVRWRQYTPYF